MVKKEFYPLDFDYDNEGNILIFGKTTNNERIVVKDDSVNPYFYVLSNGNKSKEIFRPVSGSVVLLARSKEDEPVATIVSSGYVSCRSLSERPISLTL